MIVKTVFIINKLKVIKPPIDLEKYLKIYL